MIKEILSSAKPSKRTLRVSFMVVLIMGATFSGAVSFSPPGTDADTDPVGSAEALSASDVTNFTTSAVGGAVNFWLPMGSQGFFWGATTASETVKNFVVQQEDYEGNYSELDATQTQTDIHANTRISWDKSNNLFAVVDNYNANSRNVAWRYTKEAIVEELNSGGTEGSAKTRAKTAIRDFYAQKQLNLINSYKATFNAAQYHEDTYRTQIGGSYLKYNISTTLTSDHLTFKNHVRQNISQNGSATYTLANGTTVTYPTQTVEVAVYDGADNADIENHQFTVGLETTSYGEWHTSGSHDGYNYEYDAFMDEMIAPAPTVDHDDAVALNHPQYATRLDAMESQKTQMIDNADAFVNATYQNFTSGQINTSELVDPYMLSSDYSSNYSQTGWYAYAVGQSAMLGTEVPDLNQTSLMNISVDGFTHTGLIAGNMSVFNHSLNVSESYTFPSDGTYYFITEDGKTLDLSGETITIESANDKDGTSLDRVDFRNYNYQSTSVTDLENELNTINELQQDIEDLENALLASGSSGWNFPDLSNLGPAGIGILLLIGAALLGGKA